MTGACHRSIPNFFVVLKQSWTSSRTARRAFIESKSENESTAYAIRRSRNPPAAQRLGPCLLKDVSATL